MIAAACIKYQRLISLIQYNTSYEFFGQPYSGFDFELEQGYTMLQGKILLIVCTSHIDMNKPCLIITY